MIPVYEPYLPPHSLKYAHDALDSGWISWHGKYCDLASEKLKEILGVKHVLLVSNGTCAGHLVSKCLARKYPGITKIYVPDNVYVAAWNVMLFDGNFNLDLVEANQETWNAIPNKVDDSSAILVVHNLGNVVNVPEWIKTHPNVPVVEDACEAFGGTYNGAMAGTKSLCSCFSFFANKTVTCGEGGAFATNDDEMYDYAKRLSRQGQSERQYIHDLMGFNYRMTNVQAAILCGQLDMLDEIRSRKDHLFEQYRKGLGGIENISFQREEAGTSHSKWMFGVRISGCPGYEHVRELMSKRGIDTRPMFYPAHVHPYLKAPAYQSSCLLSRECFMLPSHPSLSDLEISTIIESIKFLSQSPK